MLILSGTGGAWLAGIDPASFARPFPEWSADTAYDGRRISRQEVERIPTAGEGRCGPR